MFICNPVSIQVRDPKAAITANLDAVLTELVASSQADNWREREGAVLALTDVLGGGRSYAQVGPHLEALW